MKTFAVIKSFSMARNGSIYRFSAGSKISDIPEADLKSMLELGVVKAEEKKAEKVEKIEEEPKAEKPKAKKTKKGE